MEDSEPTLEASTIPSTDQFVDAQEAPSEAVLGTEGSSTRPTAVPVSTQREKDAESQDETTFEDTTPVLQSTTAEHTGASEAVTVSESIDSGLSDDVKTHTEFQPLSSSVPLQQEDEALPTTDSQYFISGDVHHADKQPIEPVSEREESSSLMDRASSFATNLISSVTSHLPSSTSTETHSTAKTASGAFEEEPTVSHPSVVHSTAESSQVVETPKTTFHELNDDTEPLLEASWVSPTRLTIDEFVDAPVVPKEVVAESKDSTDLVETATAIVDRVLASVATVLPTSKVDEEVSSPLAGDASTTTESTETDAVHADDTVQSSSKTIFKSSTDLKTDSEGIEQLKEPETGSSSLLEIMKSFPPSSILSKTSPTSISSKASFDTSHDQKDTIPVHTSPGHLHTVDHDVVEKEKQTTKGSEDSTAVIKEHTPAESEATTSTAPRTDEDHVEQSLQSSVSLSNLIQLDWMLHAVHFSQASATEEHGLFDQVVQVFSNLKENISNLGSSTEQPSTTASEEDSQQLEISEDHEAKQTLLQAAQEILAAPLRAAVATYERIVSSQDDSSSRTEDQEPSLKVSIVEEEAEPQQESEEKSSHQQLQVIGDDYSRYSTHYSIADAEAKVDLLYRDLSLAIEQLDQQPSVSSVEFQPEPHSKVETPLFDREALADTQDTREKVHELAQLSSGIVTTNVTSPERDEKAEDGFQVVQRRKRVPSSTVHDKVSTTTTTTSYSNMSPHIDLEPVVLHGRPDIPVPLVAAYPPAATTTSAKKKNKKRKKDKDEEILFDAPLPFSSATGESKPIVELPKENTDTAESNLLASAVTNESSEVDQIFEAGKPLHSSSVVDEPAEEQREPASVSVVSDIEELKNVDDENNDSTSSDASQLLSSFTTLPDDEKIRHENTEKSIVIETITTTTTTTVQPETSATSYFVTEPESDEPSLASSSSAVEKAEAEPKLTATSSAESTHKTVPSKNVTAPVEVIDDDEGFQMVTSKSATQKKKASSVSSKASFEGTSSPDVERKSVTSSERQDTSTSTTPSSGPTAPKTAARKKKDKKPKQDTSSADAVIISSSPAEISQVQETEQQPKKQVSQPSTVTLESKVDEPSKEEKTGASSQVSSSSLIDQSSVAAKAALPPTGKTPSATIRVKASTSPEEEEEDDGEGFQVVHYGKRISSAPRLGKTTSSSPSKAGYQQKYSRNTEFRPRGGPGRPGSETRSIPRRAPGDQRPPNRPQQNQFNQGQAQIPPFGAPRSTVTSTRQMSSSPHLERRPVETSKPPMPDSQPQTSDSQLQSSFIDQTWSQTAPSPVKTFEQEPTISSEQQTTATLRSSLSDQYEQQQETERRPEQFATIVSSFTPAPPQQTSQQASPPVKVEPKSVLPPPAPTRAVAPPIISSPTASASRKTALPEDEDEDGFRVVRYRKNQPSSMTSSPTISKHGSVSSDSEKKQISSPKKVTGPALPKAPVRAGADTAASKTKPKKTRTDQEESLRSTILTSSTTDSDLHSSSKSETAKQRTTDSKPSSSTVEKPQPVQQEVLSTQTTEKVDELAKKPKKKHKRAKQEQTVSGQSTPSDEPASFAETTSTTTSTTVSAPLSQTPSVPEEKTDPVIIKEETTTVTEVSEETLASGLTASTSALDQEEGESSTAKKSSKRRKKKSQSKDDQGTDAKLMTSSTTSTTDDKEISSTGPAPSSNIQSETRHRSVSDDDKQESEWRTAQGRSKKSKAVEPSSPSSPQALSFYPQSRLQPTSSKIVPEKVTDVQFKFKKSGELTVTSPSPVERSPTEWGTITFVTDQPSPSPSAPPEEPSLKQESISQPTVETTTEILSTAAPVSQIEDASETQTIDSNATLSTADLNAYRDPTGRLRRKKPRKHSNSTSKSESTTSSVKDTKSADSEGDRRYIADQGTDVLVSATSNPDDERKSRPQTTEQSQPDQSFEDEDTSESSSKLDTFLPSYIRQQMKASQQASPSPRSSSFTDDRSKSSSAEPSMPFSPSRLTRVTLLSSSNRSTSSTDTSENESRRQSKKSIEQDLSPMHDTKQIPAASVTTSSATVDSASTLPTESTRKRKQRQKMLKNDVEANKLLTQEFDETPLANSAPSTSTPVTQTNEDETKVDQSFLASIRQQFSSVISSISDTFSSALPHNEPAKAEEQSTLQADEPVPSVEESSITTSTPATAEALTATNSVKKSSTRSPRKRSKRDSGPDYDSVSIPSTDETEQPTSAASTSADHEQTETIKVETHKQQSRQRTASGRQTSAEEEHEQRADLADDEADESTGSTSKRSLQKKKSSSDETEPSAPALDEPPVNEPEVSSDPSASNEQLRPVQGFHTFSPNLYQYNQYEEGTTVSNDPVVTPTKEPSDTILARGFNLWLEKGKELDQSSSAPTKDSSSSMATGLTRAMQSLIIQPMESDDDEEDEEDSWNGPRAKKPTYTTGIRTDKRIHSASAYNINHPRSANAPSWLIAPSSETPHPDDPSRFDPDEEEDSIDDTSEKQTLASTINTQLSTVEERQTHLNNLADMTFQPTITTLSSSSSSSLSSAAKWNEASMRSEDPSQQQTNFTEDDVQRCLGEDFFRESLTGDLLASEQRTLTSLEGLVLKPSQLSDDIHHHDDSDDEPPTNRNSNNNNNHRSINFDEWAHFLERQNQDQMPLSSVTDARPLDHHDQPISYECSYARALNEDTFVSDLLPIDPAPTTKVECVTETETRRYGDFASLHEHSPLPETTVNRPLQRAHRDPKVFSPAKPSETFHRWRNQSGLERQDSNSTATAMESSNDDEIFVSHSDGGLSRRVQPPT